MGGGAAAAALLLCGDEAAATAVVDELLAVDAVPPLSAVVDALVPPLTALALVVDGDAQFPFTLRRKFGGGIFFRLREYIIRRISVRTFGFIPKEKKAQEINNEKKCDRLNDTEKLDSEKKNRTSNHLWRRTKTHNKLKMYVYRNFRNTNNDTAGL